MGMMNGLGGFIEKKISNASHPHGIDHRMTYDYHKAKTLADNGLSSV
jgi:hypothetical protein